MGADEKTTTDQLRDRRERVVKALDHLGNVDIPDRAPGQHLLDELREKLRDYRDALTKRIEAHQDHDGPTVMFDAVAIGNIPADAKAIGCYIGPSIVTCPAVADRFPHARRVKISQAAYSADALEADCVDVEPQDATNEGGADWAKRKLAQGDKRPILYTSASNVAALVHALASRGVGRGQVRIWSAHYTFHEHICAPDTCGYPTADGTQWTDRALGRSLDQSKLRGDFW